MVFHTNLSELLEVQKRLVDFSILYLRRQRCELEYMKGKILDTNLRYEGFGPSNFFFGKCLRALWRPCCASSCASYGRWLMEVFPICAKKDQDMH